MTEMDGPTSLQRIDQATRMLAEAKSLDDILHIRDLAESARTYARAAKLGLEAQNHAAEIKIRAERRAGEVLARIDKADGGDAMRTRLHHATEVCPPTLAELGIEKTQSHRWQMIASVPDETFEQHITAIETDGQELTSQSVYRIAQQLKQADQREERAGNTTIARLDGRYRTIVIDPPWPVEKILREVRPNQDTFDYPTMEVDQIAALPVPDLAETAGCHVYLWVTHRFLPEGFYLFDVWGVKYQCLMTWVKPTGFTPFSWMYNTEHVLFGRVGNLPLDQMGLKLSFEAPVTRHSEKPPIFYERVRAASPGPRLEMFARQVHEGFAGWGNEFASMAA